MSKRRIITVKITTNTAKLWLCRNMLRTVPKRFHNKTPDQAGREITIIVPGEKSPYCDGVVFKVLGADRTVCTHQIDLPDNFDTKDYGVTSL